MEQLERIRNMEEAMRRAEAAVRGLETALSAYLAVQDDLAALSAYLASPEWKADFAVSEDGALPADLPCGVLSEDGLYNLLEDARQLSEQLTLPLFEQPA